MAKITFRRAFAVVVRTQVFGFLPLLGGLLFIAGSCLFWPSVTLRGPVPPASYGAGLYVVGSIFYVIAPLFDLIDLSFSLSNLIDAPGSLAGLSTTNARFWETLYKAQLLRSQRSNALIYILAGICFTIGSFFFFPWIRQNQTHGAWLYVMGSIISLIGATLAMLTANDLKRTARSHSYPSSALWMMPWLSDEEAAMASCAWYMIGDVGFGVGSVFFFPKMYKFETSQFSESGESKVVVAEADYLAEHAAVVLFITASVAFALGGAIDFILLLRQQHRNEGPPAPTEVTKLVAPSGS